jgi:heme A synthase
MSSHLVLLLVFSFLVALVFAMLLRDDPRAQIRFGGMVFGGFVVSAILLGWLMYPFPI